MFTGIIEEKGKIVGWTGNGRGKKTLHIFGPSVARQLKVGRSISVNGVCLTVTQRTKTRFSCDLTLETLRRTNMGQLQVGDAVNLETALTLDKPLDGHLVQGHVDGTGRVKLYSRRKGGTILRVTIPEKLSPYVAEKGSIAIDGVSLTVTKVRGDAFEVVLIPHTEEVTNLDKKKVGDVVNLEIDPIARYLSRFIHAN